MLHNEQIAAFLLESLNVGSGDGSIRTCRRGQHRNTHTSKADTEIKVIEELCKEHDCNLEEVRSILSF